MKNLKTKVGISLTALACFTALGLTPIASAVEEGKSTDPDVMKVVEVLGTIKDIREIRYTLPDGRGISFNVEKSSISEEKSCLVLYIKKPDKEVVISDYRLNNLDSEDVITYRGNMQMKSLKFNEFSKDVQEEIKKEYTLIIKEAPERLLQEYNKSKDVIVDSILELLKR